jgi:hypothetical protein
LVQKSDFGKVPVKKLEENFAGTKKDPAGLNPTGQTSYHN